ncbi:MAG: SusC/RagA family TonB-linked outer membrane protein [Tannerellaceae bacterium]|jgi:TonB-linked SusC/RagA family outer membrane protein|nr:SusC/RagA family TonB-linked outer membrane protein [Tannerellaceae bacterium]
MKLSTFLLFVFLIQLQAKELYSQTTVVQISNEALTLKELISEIEEQTGYLFVYSNTDVDINRHVTIHTKSRRVSDILKDVFSDGNIAYWFGDNYISLRKVDARSNDATPNALPRPQQDIAKITVRGVVSDEAGPIIGANIMERGTTNGTVTDLDGEFSLSVSPGAVLVVSFIGYMEQQIRIGTSAGSRINITLVEDRRQLDEVVVTALGIKRQTKALTYSAAEVKGDELGQSSDVNIMNSLSGKIAGVDIATMGTGIAGSSKVLIRGNTTINGDSNPMYVVDGIQISLSSFTRNSRDFGDVLNTLNPDDIETISVLKGAAATALYGSQAANGVVLITTKKGSQRKDQNLGVTYSGSFGFEEYVNPFRNRQTTYGVGIEGKKPDVNVNGWGYNAHQEWGAKYDGSEAYYPDNVTPVPWGYSYHELPWDSFTRSGFFANNALAFSGGSETQNYRLSVSDMRQQSPLPNSDMNRQTISLNTSSLIGTKLHVDAKLEFSTMKVKNRPNTQSYVWTLGHMPTMWDLDWAKGTTSKIGANEAGNMLPWSTNEYYHNPYWASYQNEANDQRDRVNAVLSGRYDITPWLYATGRIGIDLNVVKARTVEAYGATQFSQGTGSVDEFTNKDTRWNADYSIVFNKDISKFNVNAMFGGSLTHSVNNRDGLTGTRLTIPYYHEVTNASVLATNVSYSEYGINSLYGSAEVSYNNFVYLTATGRNDWFSSLSPASNSIFYPSVGLSYIFSQHFKLPSWVTFGKFRASYAQVGGGANPYMTKFGYTSNALGYAGYPLLSLPATIPKSDLMPYETREYEAGIDMRFFDNRLALDYAYYDKLTSNDIVSVSAPLSSGYTGATVNLGQMSNKGHEFMLTVVPVRARGFEWSLTFTYTFNTSRVLDLGGVSELQVNSYGDAANATTKQIVGQPFTSIVGYTQAIDEGSGQPIWYWNASRGIWFPQKTSEPVILGSGLHPNMGSISTSLSYKGFTLQAMIDAKWGAKVFSYSEWDMTARGHSKRTVEYREGGIPVEGVYLNPEGIYVPLDHDTSIPYERNNFENYYRYGMGDLVSYNVFDASYVKMRQLSLAYTLPNSALRNLPIRNVRLSLVGRNLFDIVNKLPNGDASTLNNNGLERFALPATRNYSLNINLSF